MPTPEQLGPLGADKYREYLGDIKSSGEHLLEVINDILDVARIEANRVELRFEEVILDYVVDACIRLVIDRARAMGLTISSDVIIHIPRVRRRGLPREWEGEEGQLWLR